MMSRSPVLHTDPGHHRPPVTDRRRRRRLGWRRGRPLGAALAAGALVGALGAPAATPVAGVVTPAAPTVTVTPSRDVPREGASLVVQGSGFDPNRNNGVGIYVVFGPRAPEFWRNANLFAAAKWVHRNATSSPGQAPLRPDGSFSVTLEGISARYTDGDGRTVDCLTTGCYVITMAAHGLPDRSQDTFTPIAFAGAPAPTPTTTVPGPAPTTPGPGAPTGGTGVPTAGAAAGPGTTPTGPGTAPLPTTGAETFTLVTFGLALLCGGLTLLVVAPRPRPRRAGAP